MYIWWLPILNTMWDAVLCIWHPCRCFRGHSEITQLLDPNPKQLRARRCGEGQAWAWGRQGGEASGVLKELFNHGLGVV